MTKTTPKEKKLLKEVLGLVACSYRNGKLQLTTPPKPRGQRSNPSANAEALLKKAKQKVQRLSLDAH
jgi:hypothetical protein